jgi:hypothetical protein
MGRWGGGKGQRVYTNTRLGKGGVRTARVRFRYYPNVEIQNVNNEYASVQVKACELILKRRAGAGTEGRRYLPGAILRSA